MIKEFDPRSSLEDIAAQVPVLEQLRRIDGIPLYDDERVEEWMGVIGRRTAAASSRWNTGRRTTAERRDLVKTNKVRMEWMREIGLDLSYRAYGDSGDADTAKQKFLRFVEEQQERLVVWDYEMRLEASGYERIKKWIAQRPVERLLVPLGVSGLVNTAALQALELSSSRVDFNLAERGGMIGIMTVLASVGINAFQRNGPPQIGMAFRNLSSTSIKTYMMDTLGIKDNQDSPFTLDELLLSLSKRDLKDWKGQVARASQFYDVESSMDLSPYVDHVLSVAESEMYECYDIDPEADSKSWRERAMGRLALAA